MKLFGIEETPGGVTLHLPSGRPVTLTTSRGSHAGAQALGRHVLAALRSPSEPEASVNTKQPRASWPTVAAEHLRASAFEILRPYEGETLASYVDRVQSSTPAVLYRTLERMARR